MLFRPLRADSSRSRPADPPAPQRCQSSGDGTEKAAVQTLAPTATRWMGKMPKRRAWKNSKGTIIPWREHEIRPYSDPTRETENKRTGQRPAPGFWVTITKEKQGLGTAIPSRDVSLKPPGWRVL